MKCIIPGPNVKVLSRAVHFLSKIGDELYIESIPTGLCIRTLNQNKTSYAIVNFNLRFFSDFECNSDNYIDNHCKISIKPCLKIFKSLHKIKSCEIKLDGSESKIDFRFHCKSETTKNHSISILEYEKITQIVIPEEFPNSITAPFKLFSEILNNFHSTVEEITLKVNSDKVLILNHIFNEREDNTTMRTKCCLNAREFEPYIVEKEIETSITFSLRDFKSIVHFAEQNRIPLEIEFENAGRPLLLRLTASLFSINFILSTLRPDCIEDPPCKKNKSDTVRSKNKENHKTVIDSLKNKCNTAAIGTKNDDCIFNFEARELLEVNTHSPLSSDLVSINHLRDHNNRASVMIERMDTNSNLIESSYPTPADPSVNVLKTIPSTINNTNNTARDGTLENTDLLNSDEDFLFDVGEKNSDETNPHDCPTPDDLDVLVDEPIPSSQIQDNNLSNNQLRMHYNQQMKRQINQIDSEDIMVHSINPTSQVEIGATAEDDTIPGSPIDEEKRKRTEFIFRRCFESTFNIRKLPDYNVLAENSDDD